MLFSGRRKKEKEKKESGSKLVGRVLHLIAKVKWECDNDSVDTEQLREASQHWQFLDADTFLIQRPPRGSEVTISLSEKKFSPPCGALIVTWNLQKPIPNIRLCRDDHTDDPSLYIQHAKRMMAPPWPACLTAHFHPFASRTAGGEP